MAGYLNSFIRIPFPELGGNDDEGNPRVWVLIRNPRLFTAQELLGGATIPVDEEGKPVDAQAASEQTMAMMTKLIVAGRVWDPTWVPELDANGQPVNPNEEPPLLAMPPTAEVAGKLPMQVINAVGEEVGKVSPK